MASAEDHERRQEIIAKIAENSLDFEAAILDENKDNPEEAQKLLESFNKHLDELR